MNEKIDNYINKFKKISKKKWIMSVSKSFGSVGLTFEKELNKSPDSMYFPDYYGVEIKCTTRYSNYPFYLFTVAFDGPTFPEIDRIVNKYGWFDKDFPDKKVLFTKLSVKQKHKVNRKYYFKLDVDEENEKVYLLVYDLNGKQIEKESYIYTQSIFNHLIVKLNTLAIVYASKKKANSETYFRYYKTIVYELKSFEVFIKLLKEGIIIVDLISRISKSGSDKGRYRNKNLVFSISKDNMEKLFNKIYEYDTDCKK